MGRYIDHIIEVLSSGVSHNSYIVTGSRERIPVKPGHPWIKLEYVLRLAQIYPELYKGRREFKDWYIEG